jgi:hypothetical protein
MSINGFGSAGDYLSYKFKNDINKLQSCARPEDAKVKTEEYLKELKQEYSQISIEIGSVPSANAENLAFSSSGIHNINVSPIYLKKVIDTPEKRLEFKKSIQEIINAQKWMESMCRADGSKLIATGVIIDSEGNMSSWSHTQRSSSGHEGNKLGIYDSVKAHKKEYLKTSNKKSDDIEKKSLWKERLLRREQKILDEKLIAIKNRNRLLQKKQINKYINNTLVDENIDSFKSKM